MAALSAHLPGSLALWCFIAFMCVMHWFIANKYDTIRYEFWKGKESEVGQGKSEAYGIRIANVASNFARLFKIYPDEGDSRSTIPKYVHLYLPQR